MRAMPLIIDSRVKEIKEENIMKNVKIDWTDSLKVLEITNKAFQEYLKKGVRRDCAMSLADQDVKAMKADSIRDAEKVKKEVNESRKRLVFLA